MAKRTRVKRSRVTRLGRKKKATAKGAPKKRSPRPTKPGVRIRIKKNPRLIKRLAELGMSTHVVDEAALGLFFELEKKHAKPAELTHLYEAAIKAMQAAVFQSDNPEDWIRAARRAAGLS